MSTRRSLRSRFCFGFVWAGIVGCAQTAGTAPDLSSQGDLASYAGDGGYEDPCPSSAKLIYTIDRATAMLSSFNPATLAFSDVGVLNCPTTARPFSMSVDRSATAWVNYSGELFRVDTADASCSATAFVPRQPGYNYFSFGMGFAADSPGGDQETLFIATGAVLGRLDLNTFKVTQIGSTSGLPELTGTGDAKLWGFFPSMTNQARVVQFDKTNAAESGVMPLPGDVTGNVWAFAFWGGDFWLFLAKDESSKTAVYRLKPNGMVSKVIADTGRLISGAGVSTCAPIIIG